MTHAIRLLAGAAVAAVLAAAPASAELWSVTFTGTVSYQLSQSGYFPSDLAGKPVSVALTLDDTNYDLDSSPIFSWLEGFYANNPVAATVSIGGTNYALGALGDDTTSVSFSQGFNTDSAGDSSMGVQYIHDLTSTIDESTGYGMNILMLLPAGTFSSKDFRVPGEYSFDPSSFRYGDLTFFRTVWDVDGSQTSTQDYVQFGLTALSISSLADPETALPEPATWAMMIGGFGLVGGMLRRPKVRAVTA